MKVKNNPDEYIKRGDLIPGSQYTYAEKLELTLEQPEAIDERIEQEGWQPCPSYLCIKCGTKLINNTCPNCGKKE